MFFPYTHQKVFFVVSSHVAYPIKQEWSREHNASKYSALAPRWCQQIKIIFSEVDHVAYQIKGKDL